MNAREPNYPGTVTVIADWCCHRATDRCVMEAPHLIAECGEFEPPRVEPDPVPLGPWPARRFMSYSTGRLYSKPYVLETEPSLLEIPA